ncbi:MAG: hypothetical protein RR651_05585, partial [Lysinibacillus sp.]
NGFMTNFVLARRRLNARPWMRERQSAKSNPQIFIRDFYVELLFQCPRTEIHEALRSLVKKLILSYLLKQTKTSAY